MKTFDVLIPTNQPKCVVKALPLVAQVKEILSTYYPDSKLIISGFNMSAAANRNYCLSMSTADAVVMMDDDIELFTEADIFEPMIETLYGYETAMVSARLLNNDLTPATMMQIVPCLDTVYQEVNPPYLPSACVAFRNDGLRFDERFPGSGWEDTDFCDSLHVKYPGYAFIITNDAEVVHRNEMKNGGSKQFFINKEIYEAKHWRKAR